MSLKNKASSDVNLNGQHTQVMSMNVNNTYVTECICTMALFYCTLYVTLSLSVTLAFSYSSGGRNLTSLNCNSSFVYHCFSMPLGDRVSARRDARSTNCLSWMPTKKK